MTAEPGGERSRGSQTGAAARKGGGAGVVVGAAAGRGERRASSAAREEAAREALAPLAPGEHPIALRVAMAVALLLAAGVIVGALTVHDLRHAGGSLPGALFIAAVLVLMAGGMRRHRYGAVLGFEALIAFQVIVTSLALVVASTLRAAAICIVAVGLGGWLFWKLIRVMGRIQAGERGPPGDEAAA